MPHAKSVNKSLNRQVVRQSARQSKADDAQRTAVEEAQRRKYEAQAHATQLLESAIEVKE